MSDRKHWGCWIYFQEPPGSLACLDALIELFLARLIRAGVGEFSNDRAVLHLEGNEDHPPDQPLESIEADERFLYFKYLISVWPREDVSEEDYKAELKFIVGCVRQHGYEFACASLQTWLDGV